MHFYVLANRAPAASAGGAAPRRTAAVARGAARGTESGTRALCTLRAHVAAAAVPRAPRALRRPARARTLSARSAPLLPR